MLDIGPMGWDVESEAKRFGLLRTRYVVLNWPMEDIQERLRTDINLLISIGFWMK